MKMKMKMKSFFFCFLNESINVNVENGNNRAWFASIVNICNINFRKIEFHVCGVFAYEFECVCVCDDRANIVFRQVTKKVQF